MLHIDTHELRRSCANLLASLAAKLPGYAPKHELQAAIIDRFCKYQDATIDLFERFVEEWETTQQKFPTIADFCTWMSVNGLKNTSRTGCVYCSGSGIGFAKKEGHCVAGFCGCSRGEGRMQKHKGWEGRATLKDLKNSGWDIERRNNNE